jgi:hypothetical protein
MTGHRATLGRSLVFIAVGAACALVASLPLLDDWRARRHIEAILEGRDLGLEEVREEVNLLATRHSPPLLSTWGNVGGCGVGGGAASGAAVKWVGRGVTGGIVDLQFMTTDVFYLDGAQQLTVLGRAGTKLGHKWLLGVNAPFRYNIEKIDRGVQAVPQYRTGHLAGLGDMGLDIGRKLGISNASLLSLAVSFPTGSYDSARAGGEVPFRSELGSGVMGASLMFEHTVDRTWGLWIVGGSGNYGGWENQAGDRRASSLTAFSHVGFLLGPLVPSVGLSVTGKLIKDRAQEYGGEDIPGQPMVLFPVNLSLEWSSDYLAVLASSSLQLSTNGLDGVLVGLGVQTSLF